MVPLRESFVMRRPRSGGLAPMRQSGNSIPASSMRLATMHRHFTSGIFSSMDGLLQQSTGDKVASATTQSQVLILGADEECPSSTL
mmetsp:Transcript_68595/g.113564  ORF Transcript_68595/g.113564 Transcript_68595/m.113564 type:complete len:86 (+) Transcript_68595:249-506(+)